MSASPRIGIVGGGLSGALCALVLRSRGAQPIVIDAGRRHVGGRFAGGRHTDSGGQFIRTVEPRVLAVMKMLNRERLLAPWEGRFGVLGKHGGFLPSSVLASTPLSSMMREDREPSLEGGNDVDFCGLLAHSSDSAPPVFVGVPSNTSLVQGIFSAASVPVQQGRVLSARPGVPGTDEAAWQLQLADSVSSVVELDALILATHDASLAASAVDAIVSSLPVAASAAGDSEAHTRLIELADSLRTQRAQRTAPAFTWSAIYPKGFSTQVPFDAVTVPGSPIVSFLARDASKPGRTEFQHLRSKAASAGVGPRSEGELWTAVSRTAMAAQVIASAKAGENGDSDRGGDAAGLAAQAMTAEVTQLLAPFFGGDASKVPAPLDVAAKRWGAGFPAGSLGSSEDCVSLEPWRVAFCGDFFREAASPAEAAMCSGMEAAERVASWFAADEQAQS